MNRRSFSRTSLRTVSLALLATLAPAFALAQSTAPDASAPAAAVSDAASSTTPSTSAAATTATDSAPAQPAASGSDSARSTNAPASAAAAQAIAAANANVIVGAKPVEVVVEDGGAYGQLPVAQEVIGTEGSSDLVFTITAEPAHGRVGLSGGDDEDFFKNKTAHIGYFAYRADEGYSGPDSFEYTVRNQTSGLVYRNTVDLTVKPPPPVVLEKYEVDASHVRNVKAVSVPLSTRPNLPITHKLPSHEDYMTPADRIGLAPAKVAYLLDDKAKPQNGTAKLDRTTGQLTYAPNPGFIGEDSFKYYTIDENNPQLGVENTVTVSVEPIRIPKHVAVDRSRSREVDLVFVINNSPSMAGHQERIAANLRRFRRLFDVHKLDYRIGVLTTDFIDADPERSPEDQNFYETVRCAQLDKNGNPVLDSRGRPKQTTKRVATNGRLVTLPQLPQPWVTPSTPDGLFAELVKVGTNGNDNRTAFTAVYNFVVDYYHHLNSFLRPEATTIVVFFMDEEETRMAMWKPQSDGPPKAEWIENGKLPELLKEYNASHRHAPQTLDGYINYWVLRPFIVAKGNERGKLEIEAVVSPDNISHRRAAELTGGTVLNIQSDFSGPLAELGDRIANTVSVALKPVDAGATFYQKSLRVRVNGEEIPADPKNGYTYDPLTHSVRFHGTAKDKAFTAKIDITYEEHR